MPFKLPPDTIAASVKEAFLALQAEGVHPSAREVQKRLGIGSYDRIRETLRALFAAGELVDPGRKPPRPNRAYVEPPDDPTVVPVVLALLPASEARGSGINLGLDLTPAEAPRAAKVKSISLGEGRARRHRTGAGYRQAAVTRRARRDYRAAWSSLRGLMAT